MFRLRAGARSIVQMGEGDPRKGTVLFLPTQFWGEFRMDDSQIASVYQLFCELWP